MYRRVGGKEEKERPSVAFRNTLIAAYLVCLLTICISSPVYLHCYGRA